MHCVFVIYDIRFYCIWEKAEVFCIVKIFWKVLESQTESLVKYGCIKNLRFFPQEVGQHRNLHERLGQRRREIATLTEKGRTGPMTIYARSSLTTSQMVHLYVLSFK